MTFKHVKFQDSPTMRALEKVAQEKGMIKPEPMQKIAMVKKADITPTINLMENVFKLCAGLREQGFVKEAAELEVNYLNYKQAQTLYEAHKETGEDVINFAHPKGSHKLEGVEGDEAVFEDILDKHTKILDKVQKTPTGKLSEAKSILKEVRTVLGGDFLERKKDSKVSLGQVAEFTPAQLGAGGSAWSRLLGFLGKTAPKIELAETGATEAGTAGAAGIGAGAIAAAAAAALVGAIGGGYLGSVLFDHYYEVTDLKGAGDRVLDEAKDVEHDLSDMAFTYVNDFKDTLAQIETLYPAIAATKSNPDAKNIADLKNLNDQIYKSRKLAGSLWSFAQGKKDDQWFGALRGFGDVVAATANYMNVASKRNTVIEQFFNDAAKIAEQEAKKYFTAKPAVQANSPINRLSALLTKLNDYNKNNYVAKNSGGVTYVDTESREIKTLIDQIKAIPADKASALASTVEQKVATKEKEVEDFYNGWVRGRA